MFNHHLRECLDLCRYSVAGFDHAPATLEGLIVDARSWRIEVFVVSVEGTGSEFFMVPRSGFVSLDDAARTLTLDVPDRASAATEGPLTAALQDTPRFDAAALPGMTLFGRDGPAGTIVDLLVNVDLWQLRYFVIEVDSGLVATDIEWASSLARGSDEVVVDLPAVAIATAPAYDSIDNFCSGDEEAMYRHYTRSEFVLPAAGGRLNH